MSIENFMTFFTDTASKSQSSSLGSLFKKPVGSWECDTCMVQNKAEAEKCVACETCRQKLKPPAPAVSTPSIKV